MFFDRLKVCCDRKGLSVSAVTKAIGLSSGTATKWKIGMIPSADTVKLVADYLKVSMDYLMSDTEDVHNRPLTDNEVALLALFEKLGERDQVRFIGRLEEFVEASNL